MIARTSLEAYDPDSMEPLKERIYDMILECNMLSNRDIAVLLGKDNGTISGRTNELCKEKRIIAWTTKKDTLTGKTVKVWGVV